MDQPNGELPYTLQVPVVDPEDVEQEYQLRLLTKGRASRHIIRRQLETAYASHPIFSGDLGSRATGQPFASSPVPSFDTIDRIVQWACQQGDTIAEQVFDFLEDPSDDHLSRLLKRLEISGALSPRQDQPTLPRENLSAALDRCLASPRTKDELYELARSIHPSKRPEAAVRQYLRRAVATGRVVTSDGITYRRAQ